MTLRVIHSQVSTAAEGWELVEALLTFQLSPIMPWWLAPARLLLPQQIDIQVGGLPHRWVCTRPLVGGGGGGGRSLHWGEGCRGCVCPTIAAVSFSQSSDVWLLLQSSTAFSELYMHAGATAAVWAWAWVAVLQGQGPSPPSFHG